MIALELSAEILRQKKQLQIALKRRKPLVQCVQFLACEGFQIRVRGGIGDQLFILRHRLARRLVREDGVYNRCELRMLFRQPGEVTGVT